MISISHHKGWDTLGRQNNGIKDSIKKKIIICFRSLSLWKDYNLLYLELTRGYIKHPDKYQGKYPCKGLYSSYKGVMNNADVNDGYNILKKAFLNVITADRIEDVGLHPTWWRLDAATS